MKVGTKSILFGVHQFILHPITVFIAWWKLYGFPNKIQYYVAFIVHDWGYWGKPNMDGKEGETHPELGAKIMHRLFDNRMVGNHILPIERANDKFYEIFFIWYNFTLYHSRYYAKRNNAQISKLCVADKYAFCVLPKWLYLLLCNMSGEIKEYMITSRQREGKEPLTNQSEWYDRVYKYMQDWTKEHKDNLNDSWTKIVPINKEQIAKSTTCSYD